MKPEEKKALNALARQEAIVTNAIVDTAEQLLDYLAGFIINTMRQQEIQRMKSELLARAEELNETTPAQRRVNEP